MLRKAKKNVGSFRCIISRKHFDCLGYTIVRFLFFFFESVFFVKKTSSRHSLPSSLYSTRLTKRKSFLCSTLLIIRVAGINNGKCVVVFFKKKCFDDFSYNSVQTCLYFNLFEPVSKQYIHVLYLLFVYSLLFFFKLVY